jgi:hypothetical protein
MDTTTALALTAYLVPVAWELVAVWIKHEETPIASE